MCSAFESITEGLRHTSYLLTIEFNPSNIYALLYDIPDYGNSFIITNLGNRVG